MQIISNHAMLGLISDSVLRIPRIDALSNALTTINHEHHEVHSGNHFELNGVVDLANGAVRDIQIITPNTTKWMHLTIHISTESETEFYLYEDVSISVAGTAITEYNSNRNSDTAATGVLAQIDNTSVATANIDTVVVDAEELRHHTIGAGKDAGSLSRGQEIILMQNTDYSVRFVANTAGFVNYTLSWYEHTSRD